MKILEKLADLWSASAARRRLTSRMHGVYSGTWKDSSGVDELERTLQERYPHTAFMMMEVSDRSVNPYPWACSQLGRIYARPPGRTVNGLPCSDTYDSPTTNLALSNICKQTWGLQQNLIRPRLGKEGIVLECVSPEWFVCIPHKDDPFKLEAVLYYVYRRDRERSKPVYVVWTEAYHGVFEDPQLKTKVPIKGNEDCVNPYGCVPFVLSHASYPSTSDPFKILNPFGSFSRNVLLDVMNPFTLGPEGEVGLLDLQVDVVSQVDALIKLIEAPLALEGIRPEMIKGQVTATSGVDRALQMTELEERREDTRTVYRQLEQSLYDVCVEVVDVDRRRPCYRHVDRLLPGVLHVDYADIGPAMSLADTVDLWIKRLGSGLASAEMALADLEDLPPEDARQISQQIRNEQARLQRARLAPPPA